MSRAIVQDIPRIFTALAEWLACLVYISQLPLRRHGWRLWLLCGGMGLAQIIFLCLTRDVPLMWWMPCMACAVALMGLLIYLCCAVPLRDVAYSTIRAFILAEFAASLEWQLYFFLKNTQVLNRAGWKIGIFGGVVPLSLIYGAVFGGMYYLENRRRQQNHRMRVTVQEMWGAVAIGVAAFLMSNLSYAYAGNPFGGSLVLDLMNTRTMMDLGGLAILYAYHVQRGELHMQFELDSIQNVLQNQYVQYRQSRETIDIINRKYHDLKHQIAALRAESDPQRRNLWLDEMEADIKNYEAQNKTGNPVLDTVLTSKSLYCQKHGIVLTSVVDGTQLDFMDVRDICTIFGNGLDNAIECELNQPDKDKRLIHLTVAAQKGFLMIRMENYCEQTLQYEGGLPVTTKEDHNYHGYGLKSIRFAVQKYDGSVKTSCEDNWFELRILIALPQQ